jgi:hypothetical protein
MYMTNNEAAKSWTVTRIADWGTRIYFSALIHSDGSVTLPNGRPLPEGTHVLTEQERAEYLSGR